MFLSSDFSNYSLYEPFTQEVGYELKQQELKPVVSLSSVTPLHTSETEQQQQPFTHKISNTISNNVSTSIIIYICLSLFALFIAYQRNELYMQDTDGTVKLNFSLILCILFFHQFYFMYALFDFFLKPNHEVFY